MAVTPATYEAIMKEVWTQDRLEKQFHDGDGVLDQIEKTDRHRVGDKALVPTHMDRSGGYTVVPPQGSNTLNGGDKQKVDTASYDYARHWFEIELDTAAIERTSGNNLAVASAMDTEVSGGVDDMRHNISAQVYGDGTGNLAQCGVTSAANDVVLADAWAIERGFLYPGQKVDIGTAADEDSVANDRTITAVDPSVPSITVDGAAVTTAGTDFVSIANSRDGATFYGMNGLANLVSDGAFGGLDSANYWRWQSAVDSTGGDVTLEKLLDIRTAITSARGNPDWNVMSPKQENLFYLLLQQQVRYGSDKGIDGGNSETVKWSGMQIDPQVDCPDDVWYMLTKKNIFGVRIDKPYWVTQKYGGSILEYKQGTTFLVGASEYMINLATNARSAHGKLTGLSTVAP